MTQRCRLLRPWRNRRLRATGRYAVPVALGTRLTDAAGREIGWN